MTNYKNVEYEVAEEIGGWKWIALAGEFTTTGCSASKAMATTHALSTIDAIIAIKRTILVAEDAATWAATTGLVPPK